MTILSIDAITKSFGTLQALVDVSFNVDEGEIVALLGPSGCGKTTLLGVIAGLELSDNGEIYWNGVSVKDTPPHLRGFGLMFQDFALFPHMNVYANIAFGLKMTHVDPAGVERRVHEMLTMVGLPDFSNRDINTLSGGEQQRIALARALAPHPHLLMLDEPLGSLDRNLRERLVLDLKTILHQMHQTAIYVTHDQEEAFTIADRIILMNSGWIEQIGTPIELYTEPATIFVARFLEMNNIIQATIHQTDKESLLSTALGNFSISSKLVGDVNLLIRPDMARLDDNGPIVLRGRITDTSFRGSNQRVTIDVKQIPLTFEFPFSTTLPDVGTEIVISLDPDSALKLYPK
jgi:ABC-type Fe3+/spermidine/putrescine transport system ATPase subunit